MDTLSAIPAFDDNYIWAFHRGGAAVVVDPGLAAPVLGWLGEQSVRLETILLTHHHPDHIGGVAELVAATGARVIGHDADRHRLPPLDLAVADGEQIELLGGSWQVLATPGHTLGHVCYHGAGRLFCGDTLFSAGCGRMFEGNPRDYQASLARLARLPDDTAVCCAHEYTLGNLQFASQLTPSDESLAAQLAGVRAQRQRGAITLPSALAWEKRYNPYLRCSDPVMAAAVGLPAGADVAEVFGRLRAAKDRFRAH